MRPGRVCKPKVHIPGSQNLANTFSVCLQWAYISLGVIICNIPSRTSRTPFAPQDIPTLLGGLILTNGVANANSYLMVEIILKFDSHYRDKGNAVAQSDNYMYPL